MRHALAMALVALLATGGASAKEQQINVTATLTANTGVRLPPRGRSGDLQRQRWRVTDQAGRSIGRVWLACVWVVQQRRFCAVELQMPLGNITASGTSANVFGGGYVVTGGTGRYLGAGGVLFFTATGLRKQVLRVMITN